MAGKQRRKLSLKGAKRLMWAIIAICTIFATVIVNMTAENDNISLLIVPVALLVGSAAFVISYILLVEPREREEDYERLEIQIMQHLSIGEFREVYPKERYTGSDYNEMMKQIVKAEGCKFTVKLLKEKTLQLSVIDKHGEKVYSTTINNFAFFDNYFKFEE